MPITDMASECQPMRYEHDVLPAGWQLSTDDREGIASSPRGERDYWLHSPYHRGVAGALDSQAEGVCAWGGSG